VHTADHVPTDPLSALSLCIIARDEEQDIGACIASARGVVSEVVVADTGSTDSTIEVAQAHGARVIRVDWCGDFSAARNASLEAASGRFALVLDADEVLAAPEHAKAEFQAACADESFWGWQLRQRNLAPPNEMVEYSDAFPTRLFRLRPGVRYESPIHEQVTASILRAGGRVGRLDVTILHHGYARPMAQGASRAARNVATLQKLVLARPLDAYVQFQLGCALQASGSHDAALVALGRARELGDDGLSVEVRSNLRLRLAQLALGRRDDGDAARLAAESLALDPDNIVALQVLAVASAGSGDLAAAHGAFVRLRGRPELRRGFIADVDRMISALGARAPASPGR
jgi:hypothetical protein